MQSRGDLFEFKAIARANRLDVVRQQAELGTQRRLNAADVAERGRQVMDIDGS